MRSRKPQLANALASPIAIMAILCATLLAPSIVGSAGEKEVSLQTRIASAVIYPGQAQVTRSGDTDLKPGIWRLICEDVPVNIDEASIKVDGRGTASARILGVDITNIKTEAGESPRYKELKAKLEALTAKKDSLGIQLKSFTARVAFLENLEKLPFTPPAGEKPAPAPDVFRVQDWKGLVDFIQAERIQADQKILALKKRTQEVQKDIDWTQQQLDEMKMKGEWKRRVTVECEVASAGSLTIDLAYMMPGAAWGSEYAIRYKADGGAIELDYSARITQQTGEDWKDVSVTLSTAMPQLGAAPPEITPLYIPTPRVFRSREGLLPMPKAIPSSLAEESKTDEDALGGASVPMLQVAPAEAELTSSPFAATFVIPKAVTMPSAAEPRRVLITQEKLASTISYYTAPSLSPQIFVKAEIKNPLEVPLLAGQAEVYIESGAGGRAVSNFVGKEVLGPVASGQNFTVHLGVDQDFKVTQKLEKRETLTKEGAPIVKVRSSYLITIECFKKTATAVVLKDHIPVSTVKDIKVASVDFEPKPAEEREDGIITWNLTAAPKQKLEVRIAYTIEYPNSMPDPTIGFMR